MTPSGFLPWSDSPSLGFATLSAGFRARLSEEAVVCEDGEAVADIGKGECLKPELGGRPELWKSSYFLIGSLSALCARFSSLSAFRSRISLSLNAPSFASEMSEYAGLLSSLLQSPVGNNLSPMFCGRKMAVGCPFSIRALVEDFSEDWCTVLCFPTSGVRKMGLWKISAAGLELTSARFGISASISIGLFFVLSVKSESVLPAGELVFKSEFAISATFLTAV